MSNKDLTEFGRREAMSHENVTNVTQSLRAHETRYKYSKDKARVFCNYLREAITIEGACQAANISRRTYYRWMEQIPEFKELVNAAEADIEAECATDIKRSDDWRAKAWFLERRFPQRWGVKRELEVNVTKQTGTDVVHGMLANILKQESTDDSEL